MKLQFINHCEHTFLVGINGKDIRTRGSGGELDGVPYLALGNDEIESSPALADKVECPVCGMLVEVEESKPVEGG